LKSLGDYEGSRITQRPIATAADYIITYSNLLADRFGKLGR